jgi:5-hydroxyisourate hydrolase
MTSTVSTHILDAARGRPADGVPVRLERLAPPTSSQAVTLAQAVTNADGRISDLAAGLTPGTYRLVFDVATYFSAHHVEAFYPEVGVTFWVSGDSQHYHVPLLLSPFAYSTYRGS